MTHERLIKMAEAWLRRQRCDIVLSEQGCSSGEMPDAIGWKAKNHSILIECKVSRADFLADAAKPWRKDPSIALGNERLFAAPAGMLKVEELPKGWGLLEADGRGLKPVKRGLRKLREAEGLMNEMSLLLASLRRVEVRIEPQRIGDFLKWKNRMAAYNGGALPEGIAAAEQEENVHLA
ncbi:MAG: hypothetical protein P4M01_09950 [Acidobacteriota bacterium]|nr:hypothetical protein [Acidobacteriota bacterium]